MKSISILVLAAMAVASAGAEPAAIAAQSPAEDGLTKRQGIDLNILGDPYAASLLTGSFNLNFQNDNTVTGEILPGEQLDAFTVSVWYPSDTPIAARADSPNVITSSATASGTETVAFEEQSMTASEMQTLSAGPVTMKVIKARQIFDSRGNPTVDVDVAFGV